MNIDIVRLIQNNQSLLNEIKNDDYANKQENFDHDFTIANSILAEVFLRVFDNLEFNWSVMSAPVALRGSRKPILASTCKMATRFDPNFTNRSEYIEQFSQELINEFNKIMKNSNFVFYRPLQPMGKRGDKISLAFRGAQLTDEDFNEYTKEREMNNFEIK